MTATSSAERLWSGVEALCRAGTDRTALPFGVAYADPRHPDLPEANRLIVREAAALTPARLDEALRDLFDRRGIRAAGAVASAEVADACAAALEPAGFEPAEPCERIVLAAPARAPSAAEAAPDPAAFETRAVETERDWIAVETLESELAADSEMTFERSEALGRWLRPAAAAAGAGWILATLAGAPAACAGVVMEQDTPVILRLVERPVMKRRGVGAALVGAILAGRAGSPSARAVLSIDAGDESLAASLRGFGEIGRLMFWERTT